MGYYESVIGFLKNIGFFDIFLPFILVYALVYGILYRVKIFGDPSDEKVRSLNSLISFAFSGIVIGSINTIRMIQELIPIITTFLIIILGFVLIGAFSLVKEYEKIHEAKAWRAIGTIILIIFAIALLLYFNIISFTPAAVPGYLSEMIGTGILFAIIIGVIYWMTKGSKTKS